MESPIVAAVKENSTTAHGTSLLNCLLFMPQSGDVNVNVNVNVDIEECLAV